MKCRYDLNKKCTEECKNINTCAWMKDGKRRAAIHNTVFDAAVADMTSEKQK